MLEHIRDKVLGLKEEERRKFYSACFSFPSSQALGFSELMEVIQKIPSRDEVRIFLSLENEDPFIIVKNSTSLLTLSVYSLLNILKCFHRLMLMHDCR